MDTSPQPLQGKLSGLRREAEEREAEREAQTYKLPYLNLDSAPVDLEAVKRVSEKEAREAVAIAIEVKARKLALVVAHPALPKTQTLIAALKSQQYEVKLFVASIRSIQQAWQFYRFVLPEKEQITGAMRIEEKELHRYITQLTSVQKVSTELQSLDFSKASVAQFLGMVFAGALANRASDVHFEAEDKSARVRYRIDGVLHNMLHGFSKGSYGSTLSRIKLLAGLKINVRGEPQDGRFTINLPDREVEVRVSIVPSEFGETTVMRLLDPTSLKTELGELGLRLDDRALVEEQLAKPNGLLLNTGPTGSGKTTTLYTFLRQINKPEIKVITIEDPIEYRLEGVDQTQVDPEAHYTFASGLRAIVRQDPDVILVGEIRDLETAEIAMQSALTGHLVFSTLHTNDAIGAVPRLLELGMRSMIIGPALNLVIAQRLVRVLCGDCKKLGKPSKDLRGKIIKFLEQLPARVDRASYKEPTIYEPVGCEVCNRFGFKGRLGIFEFFKTGPAFQELLLKEVSETSLFELARREGMVTMQEDGILKVLTGVTTFEEVEDVTGKIEWRT